MRQDSPTTLITQRWERFMEVRAPQFEMGWRSYATFPLATEVYYKAPKSRLRAASARKPCATKTRK
eukprot:2035627-Heterocapsa_arctica.AAC.1